MTTQIRLIKISLICLILLAFLSTFHFQQLFNDGAQWAFEIFNFQSWLRPWGYFRYATMLFQIPAVLSAKLSNSSSLTTWLFCVGYGVMPFLGMGWLIRVAVKKGHAYLAPVLLSVILLAMMPNWGFAVSLVHESILYGSILYCYILLTEKPRPVVIFLLSLLLLFNYEAGLVFYVLGLYLLWREKKQQRGLVIILSLAFCTQLLILFFIHFPKNSHVHFRSSFLETSQDPSFNLKLILALIPLYCSLFGSKWLRRISLVTTMFLAFFAVTRMVTNSESLLWADAYVDRIWSIPLAFILLLFGYEYGKKNQRKYPKTLGLMVLFLCAPMMIYQSRLVQSWWALDQRFSSFIKDHPGCVVLNDENWNAIQTESYVPTWSLPQLSVLMGRESKVKTILFTEIKEPDGTILKNDFCGPIPNGFEVKDQHTTYFISAMGHFDFSAIKGKKK